MGTGGHRNRRLLSWQDHHRLEDYNGSPWRRGNEKFGDLANLADRIKAMGIEPGIWYRSLLNEDETIADQFRLPHNGYLDPSAPQALDYIRQDIAQLGERSYQLVKQLYRAIFEQATWAGFMQINRTGDDTSGLQWEWTRQIGINALAFRQPQNRSFYATDADCAGISDTIDWELNRQWMDLLALTGTRRYSWYQPAGLEFTDMPERCDGYLSAV